MEVYKKWHISVVHLSDEEPVCSKRYTLCNRFFLINLLIFLELLVLPTLHSSIYFLTN